MRSFEKLYFKKEPYQSCGQRQQTDRLIGILLLFKLFLDQFTAMLDFLLDNPLHWNTVEMILMSLRSVRIGKEILFSTQDINKTTLPHPLFSLDGYDNISLALYRSKDEWIIKKFKTINARLSWRFYLKGQRKVN